MCCILKVHYIRNKRIMYSNHSKYATNKLAYLHLKQIEQNGGTKYVNTNDINALKSGDTYTYTYNDFDYVFDVTHDNQTGILEFTSQVISKGCNPGAAIHIRILNGEGKLVYIRTNKEVQGYSDSKVLLNVFKCLMKKLQKCTIKLDDDAKFYTANCESSYSDLMYRAFDNKLSLYLTEDDLRDTTNFQPNYGVSYIGRKNHIKDSQSYLTAIKTLSDSTVSDWDNYIMKIISIYRNDWESKNLKVPSNSKDKHFIEFIKHCIELKNYIIVDKLLNNMPGIVDGKFRGKLIYDNYGVSGFEEKSKLYDLPREIFKTTETLIADKCKYTC